MSLADHIKNLENTRAAKVARLEEITNKSIEAERSFDQSETDEFDDIQSEIKQIDDDLVRYGQLLKMQAASADPVSEPIRKAATGAVKADPRSKSASIIIDKEPDEKFEGQKFTQIIIAKTLGKIQDRSPVAIAQERYGKSNPRLVEYIKADVAGHGTGAGESGSELVHFDRWSGDFIEYLYAQTVYDKLGLREIPANVNIAGHDGAATGYFVGESKAIPVSALDFMDVNLSNLKVAALAISSKELLKQSSPSAEKIFRDSLIKAGAQKIDGTFLSDSAAVPGVSPAGILNGVTALTSSGTDDTGVLNDIQRLIGKFIEFKNASDLVFVANPNLAMAIGLLRNTLDQYTFPGVTQKGGNLHGVPLETGDNVPPDALILVKPSDIYRIGAGTIETSVTDTATIEMEDAPTMDSDTPTEATGKMVSMFQTESVGIKVVQEFNFAKRRASAVQWITGASYGDIPSS